MRKRGRDISTLLPHETVHTLSTREQVIASYFSRKINAVLIDMDYK